MYGNRVFPYNLRIQKVILFIHQKIEYIDDLPEYPTSHIHGYSYVVASRGRSQSEIEQLVHEIVLSTLYLLFKHLLIDYRFNIHGDNSMDQGDQSNAHFLTV